MIIRLDRSFDALALRWEMSGIAEPGPSAPGGDAPGGDDDARLVEQFLRTRSGEVFEVLVDRHKEKIFRLALAVLGPGFEAEAEEVTQEAFVAAFQQLASFRRESRFGTWLYRIAQRKAIDLRRSARVRHPHDAEAALAEVPLQDREEASPHGRAEARESQRVLLAAIRGLPDPYPTVLRLFYWLDCSVAEIAEVLGIPPGTVKSHLFRARQLLSGRLTKKGLADANELP